MHKPDVLAQSAKKVLMKCAKSCDFFRSSSMNTETNRVCELICEDNINRNNCVGDYISASDLCVSGQLLIGLKNFKS